MNTTKSQKKTKNLLLAVASMNMRISRRFLAKYSHRKSSHKFVQAVVPGRCEAEAGHPSE